MRFRQKIAYLFSIILIYLILFVLEFILIGSFIELFTLSSTPKWIINIIFLILIDPLLTYLIGEKIPFKIYGLKVEEGIEADLKKDVDL